MKHVENENINSTDNHKYRKKVATEKCFILWEIDFMFWNRRFNLLCKSGDFLIKHVNPLELWGQWGYFWTNKSDWISLYASVSKKAKTMQNISSKTVHWVFTSKFIFHYLYLLFIIFIIYFQLSTKVFSTTGTLNWTTDSSV